MRARKEERNQEMLADRKKGMMVKDIAKKYGLCQSRTTVILQNQARWNEEKEIRKNLPKRMNHDEMIRYIEDHRRKCMRKVIDVEELISKIYDPRVIHMDENGRVKREEVIMVINGLAEEGDPE